MEAVLRKRRMSAVLFILSAMALTAILTLNYSVYIQYQEFSAVEYTAMPVLAVVSPLIMMPYYIYLAGRIRNVEAVIRRMGKQTLYLAFMFSLIIVLQIILDAQKNYWHVKYELDKLFSIYSQSAKPLKIAIVALATLSFYAVSLTAIYCCDLLAPFARDFIAQTDEFEKYYFWTASFICISVIVYVFARTSMPWDSLDRVYQTDAVFVSEHYYPVFSYGFDFDWDIGNGGIRHPLTTIFTFPIQIVCFLLSNLLFFIPNIRYILYAVVEAELLIITAIVLKRLTGSRWIAILYAFSFPFFFFTVFVEKYPLIVFFTVMFVYCVVNEKGMALNRFFLVATGGTMITNSAYGLFYSSRKRIRERVREYCTVMVEFLLMMIGTGRIHYILGFLALYRQNHVAFTAESIVSYRSRFFGFTNLLASCFYPVDYYSEKMRFYWTDDLIRKINWVGLFILAISVLVILLKWRKRMVRISALSLLIAFVLEMVFNIGVGCDPLFSLCYSWAVLYLAVTFINTLIKPTGIRNVLYAVLAVVMLYLNIKHLKVLFDYMVLYSPIS